MTADPRKSRQGRGFRRERSQPIEKTGTNAKRKIRKRKRNFVMLVAF